MGGLNKGMARQADMGQRHGGRGTVMRGIVGTWGGGGGGAPGERQKASGVRLIEGSSGALSWAESAMCPAYISM